MKFVYKYIKTIFAIAMIVFCFWRGAKMDYDSLIKVYEVLLTASGILFGIFGVWVSVLYPGILEKSLEPHKPETTIEQASSILKPLFISLVLFLLMLIVVFLAPFVRSLNLIDNYKCIVKSLSSGMAAIIFVELLREVVVSMAQTEGFQTLISRNAIIADMKNRFMSGTRITMSRKIKEEKK